MFDTFGNYLRTLGDGLFDKIRSFTIARDTLVIIDSLKVRLFGENGDEKTVHELSEEEVRFPSDAVDIAVHGDKLFVLSMTKIIVLKLQYEERVR